MSAITLVLPQLARLDIFNEVPATEMDIRVWVANQDYLISVPLSSKAFSLDVRTPAHVKAALANDCNRMAIAAFETISGISKDQVMPKSGAWGVIRAYYAAFFAAHGILRLCGVFCSQLDSAHVRKIFEVADLLGQANELTSLEKGFFQIIIDLSFRTASFDKLKDSHRDTWGAFLTLISRLIDDVPNTTALSYQKLEASLILSNIKDSLTQSGYTEKGNWLSSVRNHVNYQHGYGVWYPYKSKNVASDILSKLTDGWQKEPALSLISARIPDIKTFFEISTLITSVFREFFCCLCKTNRLFQCDFLQRSTQNVEFNGSSVVTLDQSV